jgi:hypothetical protein
MSRAHLPFPVESMSEWDQLSTTCPNCGWKLSGAFAAVMQHIDACSTDGTARVTTLVSDSNTDERSDCTSASEKVDQNEQVLENFVDDGGDGGGGNDVDAQHSPDHNDHAPEDDRRHTWPVISAPDDIELDAAPSMKLRLERMLVTLRQHELRAVSDRDVDVLVRLVRGVIAQPELAACWPSTYKSLLKSSKSDGMREREVSEEQ